MPTRTTINKTTEFIPLGNGYFIRGNVTRTEKTEYLPMDYEFNIKWLDREWTLTFSNELLCAFIIAVSVLAFSPLAIPIFLSKRGRTWLKIKR